MTNKEKENAKNENTQSSCKALQNYRGRQSLTPSSRKKPPSCAQIDETQKLAIFNGRGFRGSLGFNCQGITVQEVFKIGR